MKNSKQKQPHSALLAQLGFAVTLGVIATWMIACSNEVHFATCNDDDRALALTTCLTGISAGAGSTLPESCCVLQDDHCQYLPSTDPSMASQCSPTEPTNTGDDEETSGRGVLAAGTALAATDQSLGESELLKSPSAQVSLTAPDLSQLAIGSAAEAGSVSPLNLKHPEASAGGGGSSSGSIAPKGGQSSTNSTSFGGGSGLGASGQGSSNAPSGSDANLLASAASAGRPTSGTVTYAGGTGSKLGAGSGSGSDYNSGGSGDSTTSLSFNGDGSGASASGASGPSDSITPEDYLARIPIDDSLFHRVELKMREKERTWSPGNPMNRLK